MKQQTAIELAITDGHCPDCGYRGFLLGPVGAAAMNIECGSLACRARFNVVARAGVIVLGHRIERESEGGARWPSAPKQ